MFKRYSRRPDRIETADSGCVVAVPEGHLPTPDQPASISIKEGSLLCTPSPQGRRKRRVGLAGGIGAGVGTGVSSALGSMGLAFGGTAIAIPAAAVIAAGAITGVGVWAIADALKKEDSPAGGDRLRHGRIVIRPAHPAPQLLPSPPALPKCNENADPQRDQ